MKNFNTTEFKKQAHKYLTNKGCLSMGQKYTAYEVENILEEFVKQIINENIMEELTKEEIEIASIQKYIKKLGYQWQEQVFNDDIADRADCLLEITKDTDPCIFNPIKGAVGWGRFSRLSCWKQALEYVESVNSK